MKKLINYTSRATLLQKIICSRGTFLVLRSLLYYGIFLKHSGKNKNNLRTIYHFTGSCQEKNVNSQELFIYLSFGKFWVFFP